MSFSNVLSYISKCSTNFNTMRDDAKSVVSSFKELDKTQLRSFYRSFKEFYETNKKVMKDAKWSEKFKNAVGAT